MTLDELKYKYTKYILFKNDNNRTKAAEELGICVRSLRNYIANMRESGAWKDDDNEIKKIIKELDFFYKMPTNKERLAYINNPTFRG